MKNLILASTSTLYGEPFLDYLLKDLEVFFKDIKTITFIPYARPNGIDHDEYTEIVAKAFSKIGKNVVGLHNCKSAREGLENAEAIFAGGGNTFLLVRKLYEYGIMRILKKTLEEGTPYLGTSAGTNIAGPNMQTTNDMPIIYPPSFNTLGLVNFNINVHYLDPDPKSTHNGETRETRIKEFHGLNSIPVVGLREGNFIWVQENKMTLKGEGTARVFEPGKTPYETRNLNF